MKSINLKNQPNFKIQKFINPVVDNMSTLLVFKCWFNYQEKWNKKMINFKNLED